MTQRSAVRLSKEVRRTPRPRDTGASAGFLGLLVKLARGSERLAAARPRRRS